MRKLTVFNLVTLDGYFAGPNGDISWHMVDEEPHLGLRTFIPWLTYRKQGVF